MKLNEGRQLQETAVLHCSARATCPVAALCAGAPCEGQAPLLPSIIEVEQGQMVWTALHNEHRAMVIQGGIFCCMSNPDERDELVFALYASGDSIGFPELYLHRGIENFYYAKALTEGRICSFASKPLRKHLEELPSPQRERTLSSVLLNATSAMYVQVEMLSKTRTSDRIAILFERLKELAARDGRSLDNLRLTHADIAKLVAADRVSVTRALQKMAKDGLVSLGYCSVVPNEGDDEESRAASLDFCRHFFQPKNDSC